MAGVLVGQERMITTVCFRASCEAAGECPVSFRRAAARRVLPGVPDDGPWPGRARHRHAAING